jgi:plasmid stabilization system protein ParE
MKKRELLLAADAVEDLDEVAELIERADGPERADGVVRRMESFCRPLSEFSAIGTRRDERITGLRSVGIPGLRSATVLFVVSDDRVIMVAIGYLGRDVWARFPLQDDAS